MCGVYVGPDIIVTGVPFVRIRVGVRVGVGSRPDWETYLGKVAVAVHAHNERLGPTRVPLDQEPPPIRVSYEQLGLGLVENFILFMKNLLKSCTPRVWG